jgi:hypothetical protein
MIDRESKQTSDAITKTDGSEKGNEQVRVWWALKKTTTKGVNSA